MNTNNKTNPHNMNNANTQATAQRYAQRAARLIATATANTHLHREHRLHLLWGCMDAAHQAGRRLRTLGLSSVAVDQIWLDAETVAVHLENNSNNTQNLFA